MINFDYYTSENKTEYNLAYIEYSNDMHDVYKNINEYNPDP